MKKLTSSAQAKTIELMSKRSRWRDRRQSFTTLVQLDVQYGP